MAAWFPGEQIVRRTDREGRGNGLVEVIAMQSEPRPDQPIGDHGSAEAPRPWGSPHPVTGGKAGGSDEDRRRAEAIKRVEKRRGWMSAFVAYVVVNAFLVGIWATTGRGYFWPGWVIGGWGIGMVLSFWDIFVRRPISEADIEAELRRGTSSP
jgi:hypothetical protein